MKIFVSYAWSKGYGNTVLEANSLPQSIEDIRHIEKELEDADGKVILMTWHKLDGPNTRKDDDQTVRWFS